MVQELSQGEKSAYDLLSIPELEAEIEDALRKNKLTHIQKYLRFRLSELKESERKREREEDLEIQRAMIDHADNANKTAKYAMWAAIASAIVAVIAAFIAAGKP